jgi:type IV pilus assembly protein PilY1
MKSLKSFFHKNQGCSLLVIACSLILFTPPGLAKDTDIYQVNTKQNCYILLDNSGSMDFGVYESNVDYGAMFDYLFTLNDSSAGNYGDYIYDTVNNNIFYKNHKEMRKIYLWKGAIGVTTANLDGTDVFFTGDAADPDYIWYLNDLVDTHTMIDSSGNLSGDGVGTQRITVDAEGYILLDNLRLPMDKSIKHHAPTTLYDGSVIDNGFGGLLNAPGYYFSGYEGVTPGSLNPAEDGDQDIYFFVTGNWANMQDMYNLHYTTNNPTPPGASNGDPAWKYELIPLGASAWSELSHPLQYPASGNYANNLIENDTEKTITHPGAAQIQVHFSNFDVEGDGKISNWNYDYVAVRDSTGNLVAKYDNDNPPTAGDGWSPTINSDTVKISLSSDKNVVGIGYGIDKIRVTYHGDAYLMQNRMDVAKDAMLYALDEFHGKMNWGFATFQYTGTTANGATLHSALNPNLTDDANRAAIRQHVLGVEPMYGTPLGEALQDVFEKGYWTKRSALDNLLCRKNFIISVTDGFPSGDEDWNRISDVTGDLNLPFQDWDNDNWTADPYQYANPPENFYDDVGHWLYTHSWLDKSEVADPANSYFNVTTHHIAFGMDHPLLKDAAGESGGEYIAAYNKTQLVAAFYALALQMTEAVSFTAPVVSVDAANKIQNGDDLYLGLFLPQDNRAWMGNLKKYRLGDGSAQRPNVWMIYDGADNEAINSAGEFKDNTAAFWADDNDPNDTDNYGVSDVREDGTGEVLTESVAADFSNKTYWNRTIFTYDSSLGSMKKLQWDTVSAASLNVADDLTRDKTINYTYGYTFDADPATHAPLALRDWALGSIIHSRPVVIDYYDPSNISLLLKRYIAVGANDGMLHVFDDANGKEVFAFVPEDLLPSLHTISQQNLVDGVDGGISLYRRDKQPKYLIFGERRGGKAFWALDVTDQNPLNWSVAWEYTNNEMAQSWSDPQIAAIPISIDTSTGELTFKDVLVLSGGYDSEEDSYPEPFLDIDNSGSPYTLQGNLDKNEWVKTDAAQDINNNDLYDLYNLDQNEYGRGIYVVDIDDPANTVTDNLGKPILPFSVTWCANPADEVTSGTAQKLTSMKYCFPASPSLVSGVTTYYYLKDGNLTRGIKSNVLRAVYVTDIYANVYKVNFTFSMDTTKPTETPTDWTWSATNNWSVTKVFSGNPGSTSVSSSFGAGIDLNDQGRKAFYSPVISWGGACDFFDKGNYRFESTVFSGTNDIASLYLGTGDREHPKYTMIRNRFYAVYDDSSVTAMTVDANGDKIADITTSTWPYSENHLLNLTCGELDEATALSGTSKLLLKSFLKDDATYDISGGAGTLALEDGIHEDDAKGWYIILEDQGSSLACNHCTYAGSISDATTSSRDNHNGEKILSSVDLYAGILYFTSYQPSIQDPCNPQGNGFSYAINYCDATPGYNLSTLNDPAGSDALDVTDRYIKVNNIFGIPSDFAIITRQGQAGAMAMMGSNVVGPQGGNNFRIKSAGMGLELYYWREGNSQRP